MAQCQSKVGPVASASRRIVCACACACSCACDHAGACACACACACVCACAHTFACTCKAQNTKHESREASTSTSRGTEMSTKISTNISAKTGRAKAEGASLSIKCVDPPVTESGCWSPCGWLRQRGPWSKAGATCAVLLQGPRSHGTPGIAIRSRSHLQSSRSLCRPSLGSSLCRGLSSHAPDHR